MLYIVRDSPIFHIWVSQSFLRKDLGGWWVGKNLPERIVGLKNPVHSKHALFTKANIILYLKLNNCHTVIQFNVFEGSIHE